MVSLVVLGACGDDQAQGPCAGVDCRGHGDCIDEGASARCNCDDGYVAVGLSCVEGGDSDSDVDTDADSDTDTDTDTDTNPTLCDPVAQDGCDAGEKCAAVTSGDPPVSSTQCVEDGTVPEGSPCASRADGADDCVAGFTCIGGECTTICTTEPDSCGAGRACQRYSGMFDDREGIGACVATCDPLAQECGDAGEACYLTPYAGYSTCASSHAPGVQGEACIYVNDCSEGYGCLVPSAQGAGDAVCAAFCDTRDGDPGCGVGFDCYSLQQVYDDSFTPYPEIGVCLDPSVWPDL